MHIDDDHMYHGAALVQVAEHPEFTAINRFEATKATGAFRINTSTGIYLKYALKPTKSRTPEYVFTFNQKNLSEIDAIRGHCTKFFIVMVCVAAKNICCINVDEFYSHIKRRKADAGKDESQYQILVAVPENKAFRVYVNASGVRKTSLHQDKVPRNRFPEILF